MKKKGNWFKENSKSLAFLVVGILIGVLVMSFMWPERIAKINNGEEVMAEIKGTKFTANDLYEELKSGGGMMALLNLIDLKILDEKYDLEEESEKYAKEQAEYLFNMYSSSYGYTKEQFLAANNFATEEDFLQYLEEDYLHQEYYKEYLGSLVTPKEQEDYYKKNVQGDKTIYVFSSDKKDNKLASVSKDLKKGKSYDEITKKYESITANNLGKVNFTSYANYSDTFVKELNKVSAKGVSKVFEDDDLGYVIIYCAEEGKKPSFKETKKDIIAVLSDKLASEDDTLYYKAFIKLREEYGLKFSDTSFEKEYNKLKKQYK